MNLVLNVEQFNKENVYYQEPIRNTVMDNSNFIRLLYSNQIFTLNSIFITFQLKNAVIENYFSKYKCYYNVHENVDIIQKLVNIENIILELYSVSNKKKICKITEQLNTGTIKLFANDNIKDNTKKFILKISGIWETTHEYGITYKFIDINKLTIGRKVY